MELYENNGWVRTEIGTKRVKPMEKYSYLVGIKINKWEVISIEHTRRHPDAICRCECGTVKPVSICNLINNKSKDCGCGRKGRLSEKGKLNLVGNKYGKLTVVEMLQTNNLHKQLCRCVCDCGRETVVVASSLTSNHTLSCGCLNSYYNCVIDEYLGDIDIEHTSEYTIFYKGNRYRFDFYLPDYNTFIEYDGSQHYEPTRYYGNNIEKNTQLFFKIQERDEMKNQYCREYNINLLRIPYWESKNIKTIINNYLQRLNEKGSNNLEYVIV